MRNYYFVGGIIIMCACRYGIGGGSAGGVHGARLITTRAYVIDEDGS